MSYVGIGATDPNHPLEVEGQVFISNVEQGSTTNLVPFEVYSDYAGITGDILEGARQLRLRVTPQLTTTSNVNMDMGIEPTSGSYFYISNPVVDTTLGSNTAFRIVQAGHVEVGSNLSVTGNIVASNIVGGSPLTLSSDSLVKVEGSGGLSVSGPLNVTGGGSIVGTSATYSGQVEAGTVSSTGSLFVDGNVGIGVESPSYKLDVSGNARFTGEVITGNILYVGTNTNDATAKTIYFGGLYGDNAYDHCVIENRIYASATEKRELLLFSGNDIPGAAGPDRIRLRGGEINFDTYSGATSNRTAENIRMTINGSGNVGIGITNPSYKMHVNGNLRVDSTIYTPGSVVINNGAPTLYFQDTDENSAMIHCNSHRLYFLRGGNNTTTWTQVNGRWPMYLNLTNNNATIGGSLGLLQDPFSRLTIGSDASGNGNVDELAFRSVNNSAIQRVGYRQRIGFWCRQEYSNHNRLAGSIECIYGGNVHYPTYPGNSSTNLYFYTTNTYGTYRESFRINSEGQIVVNGTVVHGSDDRIKINEERLTNATETLMKLDPQIYDKTVAINSKEVVTREAGLIIQDIWYDAPELRYIIYLAEDANPPVERPPKSDNIQEDPDYSTWGSKINHLNYSSLIPYLIKSNQEQQALIDDLDNQLQAEKQKMASLLARIEALENA